MNLDDAELCDRIAADYVIGTLRGPARRRVERLLATNLKMADAVQRWQTCLYPLIGELQPVEPPPRVWREIERQIRLGRKRGYENVVPSHHRSKTIASWRIPAVAILAIAAAILVYFKVGTMHSRHDQPVVEMINDLSGHSAFLLTEYRRSRTLKIVQVSSDSPQLGHVYQLWLLPKGEKPRSVGVLSASRETTISISDTDADVLSTADGIAVSVEPDGGSATGQPTAPILFKTKFNP